MTAVTDPLTALVRSSGKSATTDVAQLPVVLEFQPDAIEIESRTPPRIARATLYLVCAVIAVAVTWASLSRVDEIVTAPGKLVTTGPSLVVQPLETSVIRDIHVAVGDLVDKGQVLATLDPTFSQSDVEQLRGRLSALTAEIARLQAELDGREYKANLEADTEEIVQAELFSTRKAFVVASLRRMDEQIARDEANLKTSQDEEVLAASRVATMREVEAMRGESLDLKTGSRLNMLLARDGRLDVESHLSRLRGDEVELGHELEKARSERQAFLEDFRRETLDRLVEARTKRETAVDELQKAALRRRMAALTSPADAVVLDFAHKSVGSVIRDAETMFVLVARDAPLEAEVNVDGTDIGEMAVGQPVRIKFDAFPFQKYGTASGTVRIISQDAFTSEERDERHGRVPLHYRVRVQLTDVRLRSAPERVRLLPGMSLRAETKVGQRTVMSYLLYPLLRGFDESIRER